MLKGCLYEARDYENCQHLALCSRSVNRYHVFSSPFVLHWLRCRLVRWLGHDVAKGRVFRKPLFLKGLVH